MPFLINTLLKVFRLQGENKSVLRSMCRLLISACFFYVEKKKFYLKFYFNKFNYLLKFYFNEIIMNVNLTVLQEEKSWTET